jgi:hypothetical protein
VDVIPSEVEVEARTWGRARRRPPSEVKVEVEAEPWGRGRRTPPSEAEAGAEPWGRARQSFLWRLRLELAIVSLTLAGGTVVGAGQAALLFLSGRSVEGRSDYGHFGPVD